MMEPSHSARECERFEALRLAEAERELSLGEQAFVDEHEASCAACGRLEGLAAALRFDGTAPAARPLHDLARRRWLKELVDASKQEPGDDSEDEAAPERAAGWRRLAVVAAAAVVLLGAGYLVGQWIAASFGPASRPGPPAVAPSARVLLVSGDVRLEGASLRLTSEVRSGARVAVRAGRAALGLPQGSTVVAEAGTRLQVERLSADQVRLRLHHGAILLAVTRRRPGRRFEVDTPHGRVSVVGTVFAVQSAADGGWVRVYRGRVRVEQGGQRIEVPAGRQLRLGAPGAQPAPLTGPTGSRIRGERLLGLLGSSPEGETTVLDLRTRPAGVPVDVDGTRLGATPLRARLVPGQRRIELSARGHAPIREDVSLPAGGAVRREFDLRPGAGSTPRPRPGATAGTAAPPARPSAVTSPPRRVRHAPAFSPPRPRDVPGAAMPPAPPATAPDLLREARRKRAARDFPGAARIYAGLVARHPASPEAQVARVSLGILHLGPLWNPARALGAFDAYLARHPAGGLVPEARFGRARALRALGRRAQEIQALRRLIGRHPSSVQAGAARQRLKQLGQTVAPSPDRPK